jgi:hypothetical protein
VRSFQGSTFDLGTKEKYNQGLTKVILGPTTDPYPRPLPFDPTLATSPTYQPRSQLRSPAQPPAPPPTRPAPPPIPPPFPHPRTLSTALHPRHLFGLASWFTSVSHPSTAHQPRTPACPPPSCPVASWLRTPAPQSDPAPRLTSAPLPATRPRPRALQPGFATRPRPPRASKPLTPSPHPRRASTLATRILAPHPNPRPRPRRRRG